jgi:hypothetical protein
MTNVNNGSGDNAKLACKFKKDPPPKGSGLFAVCFGIISWIIAIWFCASNANICDLSDNHLLVLWLVASGFLGVYWGVGRILSFKNWRLVGQDTMTFILAMLGITFAIIAIGKERCPQPNSAALSETPDTIS